MGEQGRLRIEQKFSCEAQLENTLNLYQELFAQARPATLQAVEGVHRKGI
jgi:hypothetical protein